MKRFQTTLSIVFVAAALAYTSGCSSPSAANNRKARRARALPVQKPVESKRDAAAAVHLEVAEKFHEAGDHESAIDNYRKALGYDSRLHAAELGLAKSLAAADQIEEAVETLNNLLSATSNTPEGTLVDPVREEAERLRLEIDEVGVALRDSADLLANRGKEAERSNRDKNAVELYQAALDLWPSHRVARNSLVEVCRRNKWPLPGHFIEPAFAYTVQDVHFKLSDLVPTDAHVPNDKLRVDQTKWGLSFYNQGKVFDHGLWAPAPSRLEYDIDERYSKFVVQLMVSAFNGQKEQIEALEKELLKPGTGTVKFRVIGDGNLLYESENITYDLGPKVAEIDISGVTRLTLEVSDADGRDLLDFSVWAEGKLYM